MSGWTKGPWFVSGVRFRMDRGQWHAINRYNEKEKRDNNIACVGFDPRTGDGLADARLIAAAPDLAEAAEAASLAIGDWSRPTSANGMTMPSPNHPLLVAAEKLRAALLKAKGE